MDYDPTVRDLNNRMKRQIYTPFDFYVITQVFLD